MWRPERYAAEPTALPSIQDAGRKTFDGYLEQIDAKLAGRRWFMDQYSVADPYLLVFYAWGKRIGLPMAELKNYTAWKERMMARPAVMRVLEREQGVLLAA